MFNQSINQSHLYYKISQNLLLKRSCSRCPTGKLAEIKAKGKGKTAITRNKFIIFLKTLNSNYFLSFFKKNGLLGHFIYAQVETLLSGADCVRYYHLVSSQMLFLSVVMKM